ncbi:MAG: elongation factor P lysine(34) lysyltransferase, partial [Rhodospirillaceae bacterium]|nr:elongation factor P lysine(34) lysyltransferase [Rhodospirillaceae bacterium]
ENEQKNRQRAGQHVPPIDKSFLSALSHGLPNCAGVAIGLDRLLAIALGLESISETMSFAHPTDIY